MISRPAARSALARCETAIVADSLSWAMLADGVIGDAGVIGRRRSVGDAFSVLDVHAGARLPTPDERYPHGAHRAIDGRRGR
jgi:hypothetical protein